MAIGEESLYRVHIDYQSLFVRHSNSFWILNETGELIESGDQAALLAVTNAAAGLADGLARPCTSQVQYTTVRVTKKGLGVLGTAAITPAQIGTYVPTATFKPLRSVTACYSAKSQAITGVKSGDAFCRVYLAHDDIIFPGVSRIPADDPNLPNLLALAFQQAIGTLNTGNYYDSLQRPLTWLNYISPQSNAYAQRRIGS